MSDAIIELAGDHPIIFLGLLALGILMAVILFTLAVKISRLIIKAVMFMMTAGLIIILSVVTLAAAKHIYAALTYSPPQNPSSPPVYDSVPQDPVPDGQAAP